ncbi:hypothetical protein VTI74DRAFT_2817 [Chaetomium olivicolor]
MSSESTLASSTGEPESTHFPKVIFPAGNSDFRAVRNRCAKACREFNSTPDDADPEERTQKWLDIVRPDRNRDEDGDAAVTHDQTFANPTLKAKTPFVKPPVHIDYGVRLHVGGSTFINRNCMIMDTPVADVVIGEGCNIGSNCTIIGVTHPVRLDERLQRHSIGQPVTIGNDVWIGANVTILGGVTIGDGAVIGACSLVKQDIPPMSLAVGSPARVVALLKDVKPTMPGSVPTTLTLEEAVALENRLPTRPYYDTPPAGRQDDVSCGEGERLLAVDLDFDLDLHFGLAEVNPRRGYSAALSAVPRSVTRELALAESLPIVSDREATRQVLLQRQLCCQEQRQRLQSMRRFEVEAIAAATVAIALLIAFFMAGVYLGSSRLAGPVGGVGG